jgi:hypothetical protein
MSKQHTSTNTGAQAPIAVSMVIHADELPDTVVAYFWHDGAKCYVKNISRDDSDWKFTRHKPEAVEWYKDELGKWQRYAQKYGVIPESEPYTYPNLRVKLLRGQPFGGSSGECYFLYRPFNAGDKHVVIWDNARRKVIHVSAHSVTLVI